MRIAHVLSTPHGLGGAEHLVAALAGRSLSRGHDVRVLNLFEDLAMDDDLARLCAPAPVLGLRGAGFVGARRWLRRRLVEYAPDVVHVHLARALLVAASLRPGHRRRMLLTHHHGDLFLRQRRPAAHLVERLVAARFEVVVAVSPAVADLLTRRLGYQPDRVQTIMNGWTGRPRPRSASQVAPQVVCIARLRPEKGHAQLLEAMKEVLVAVPAASLHLLGDGPERARLQAQADRLGIRRSVHLHGDVADVWPFLARASVAVQPSIAEPFGISALEAMAAGVPLVASATGGLVDFVEDELTGLLVPPGRPRELAAAILRVLTEPEIGETLASRARSRAAGLRLADTLDQYDALYDTLASR